MRGPFAGRRSASWLALSCAELRLAYIFQSFTLVEPNNILPHRNRKAGRESVSPEWSLLTFDARAGEPVGVTTTGGPFPSDPDSTLTLTYGPGQRLGVKHGAHLMRDASGRRAP